MANKSAGRLYDVVRRTWVADQPEERVRQALLRRMIDELGYPRSLLAVEKSLKQMAHLAGYEEKLPERRADIVCFSQGDLFPLLLIECKAEPLTEAVLQQVVGYNYYLCARYIAIANQDRLITGTLRDDGSYDFQRGLPPYPSLKIDTLVR